MVEIIGQFNGQNELSTKLIKNIVIASNFDYENAAWFDIGEGVKASFVSFDLLIKMKEKAGRDKDKIDLNNLKHIREIHEEEIEKQEK
ncbi:MAG: hypothetical protein A2161_02175 [Candidatus Schekmanbacteria bacterium RBG_13_48_7]|uniref:Uncharacterized protein n=1 Tax=Candidatus Schekmanbacteria bacterium RBG_13_48_7 TaxID=1817878 RepID=A0A1F7RTC2_9BACT|nr:MAG: hypothetical protein A2161_02175 [Candidatus Schekmanbacteria bacterium RBG_13_48_7]